jgi:hypothetical protein
MLAEPVAWFVLLNEVLLNVAVGAEFAATLIFKVSVVVVTNALVNVIVEVIVFPLT